MARLEGMNQICDYVKRSDATVLSYIRTLDFPAAKLGSIWVSDTQKIDHWFDSVISNGGAPTPPVKIKKKTKNGKPKKRKAAKILSRSE